MRRSIPRDGLLPGHLRSASSTKRWRLFFVRDGRWREEGVGVAQLLKHLHWAHVLRLSAPARWRLLVVSSSLLLFTTNLNQVTVMSVGNGPLLALRWRETGADPAGLRVQGDALEFMDDVVDAEALTVSDTVWPLQGCRTWYVERMSTDSVLLLCGDACVRWRSLDSSRTGRLCVVTPV